jgi:hypothetical protein
MAARLRKSHQDDVRAKIRASVIVSRLSDHVEGKVDLSSTQVRAAEVLLKKTLPDLGNIEITGADGGPLSVNVVRFAGSIDDDSNSA